MATPNSKTAIVNLALRNLKTDPVISIEPPDDDSKAASAGAAWFDQARRDTLEAHPWKFASRRRNLVADPTAPLFEWDKQYELPNDFIRVGYLGNDWRNPITDYDIEGDFILCNETSPLPLVYVWNLTDVTKFSPKFVTALTYKLAALMAFEITGNAQLVGAMESQFDACFMKAASVNGQNRPTRRVQHSKLQQARQGQGRYKDWQRWGDT